MEPFAFILIIPFTIALFCFIKGLVKGRIKYGYKYYGKGVTANKKEDPIAYWLGIGVYGSIAVASVIVFIIKS